MRRSILLLPLCVVAATLAGCGNKGPLVMPTPPPATVTAPAPAAPAAATSTAMPAPLRR